MWPRGLSFLCCAGVCLPKLAREIVWFLSRSLSWLTHSAESQRLSCEPTHAAQRSRLHGMEWSFFQQILRNKDWDLTAMWASHPACTSPSLPQTSIQRTAVPAEMRRYPGPQIPSSATAGFLSHRNCESMNVCYRKMLHLACVCYTAWDSWPIHTPAPSSMVGTKWKYAEGLVWQAFSTKVKTWVDTSVQGNWSTALEVNDYDKSHSLVTHHVPESHSWTYYGQYIKIHNLLYDHIKL